MIIAVIYTTFAVTKKPEKIQACLDSNPFPLTLDLEYS